MSHIGVDESGKGDYFGYLVVAAVFVDGAAEKKLQELKVRDSKKLVDSTAAKMAARIRKICRHNIVKISPERYNALYRKFRNLNKILAWAHARAVENLLEHVSADFVLIDKFADERFLKKALMERGKKAKIVQTVRAESDIAVAAASVLARAEFLRTLRMLSREIGYVLPKGSAHVEEAAKHVKENYGDEGLSKLAKVHFRTTKRILK